MTGVKENRGGADATVELRLRALRYLDVLDSPSEVSFDDIVFLASQICETPIALVSLVAQDRQWFKARVGIEACETPISQSVCALGLQRDELLIIPDLTLDPRTRNNTLVTGDPHIRFYAGAPLITPEGVAIGMLCVIDFAPRGLSEAQGQALRALARQVIFHLEQRRAANERAAENARLKSAGDASLARAELSEALSDRYRRSEERLRLAQEAGKIGTFDVDVETGMIDVSDELCRIFGLHQQSPFQASELEALVVPDDRAIASRADTRRSGAAELEVQYRIRRADTGEVRWIARNARFERHVDGLPKRMFGSVQDVTDRRRTDEQLQLLNRELDHRLKNTLAMVQAIAGQTLRGVSDRDAVQALEDRLISLSRAHDILLQQSWTAADLHAVLDAVLSLHADLRRFTLSGPAVQLGPKATLGVSMLVHELATNAIKYGALSIPGGSIAIDWRSPANDTDLFELSWIERGGPPTAEPTRKGFGSRLIRLGLDGTGGADLRYTPAGFEGRFRSSFARLRQA